jgi:hypothetical protein
MCDDHDHAIPSRVVGLVEGMLILRAGAGVIKDRRVVQLFGRIDNHEPRARPWVAIGQGRAHVSAYLVTYCPRDVFLSGFPGPHVQREAQAPVEVFGPHAIGRPLRRADGGGQGAAVHYHGEAVGMPLAHQRAPAGDGLSSDAADLAVELGCVTFATGVKPRYPQALAFEPRYEPGHSVGWRFPVRCYHLGTPRTRRARQCVMSLSAAGLDPRDRDRGSRNRLLRLPRPRWASGKNGLRTTAISDDLTEAPAPPDRPGQRARPDGRDGERPRSPAC